MPHIHATTEDTAIVTLVAMLLGILLAVFIIKYIE